MKANEAPEKLYFSATEDGTHYYTEGIPFEREYIEYTRTDAFIKKACDAFCKVRCQGNPPRSTCTSLGTCKEHDDFRNIMTNGKKDKIANVEPYLALEVKEVDLNNGIQLTWEDMRELYIIFAEVDAEIEFCKTDIQSETIGYYQEVLKRFKARKGE